MPFDSGNSGSSPSYGGGSSSFGSAAGASGIEAGSTFLAQLGDYNFNKASMNHAYDINKEQAELAWKRNLEMWNMANEYNSPKSQMARFAEAGLNPNLVYGQGTAGNAGGPPAGYVPPKRDAVMLSRPSQGMRASDTLQNYLSMEMQKKQIDVMDTNIELAKKRAITEDANAELRELMGISQQNKNLMQSELMKYYPSTLKVDLSRQQAELENAIQRLGLLKADKALKGQQLSNLQADYRLKGLVGEQKTWEIGLNRLNLRGADSPLLRLLYEPLKKGWNSILDKGVEWIQDKPPVKLNRKGRGAQSTW